MGPVESAIRKNLRSSDRLGTPATGAPFEIAQIDSKGIVLLLGKQAAWTPIRWTCLEGIPEFLRGRGWTKIGSVYDTSADPTTLDGYMKHCIKRATAGWVAAVLEVAGVVEIDRGRPAKVRLSSAFAEKAVT